MLTSAGIISTNMDADIPLDISRMRRNLSPCAFRICGIPPGGNKKQDEFGKTVLLKKESMTQ